MLSEQEVGLLIEIPEVMRAVEELRQPYLKKSGCDMISRHDFFAGMLMIPIIDMALTDGNIGLAEELALNKKARRLSKGGFFIRQDPVVKMVELLVQQWEQWRDPMYQHLKEVIKTVMTHQIESDLQGKEMFKIMISSPYILVKILETFFLAEGDRLIDHNVELSLEEYHKLEEIAYKLSFDDNELFKAFLKDLAVRMYN